jgi:hypothetical protein
VIVLGGTLRVMVDVVGWGGVDVDSSKSGTESVGVRVLGGPVVVTVVTVPGIVVVRGGSVPVPGIVMVLGGTLRVMVDVVGWGGVEVDSSKSGTESVGVRVLGGPVVVTVMIVPGIVVVRGG